MSDLQKTKMKKPRKGTGRRCWQREKTRRNQLHGWQVNLVDNKNIVQTVNKHKRWLHDPTLPENQLETHLENGEVLHAPVVRVQHSIDINVHRSPTAYTDHIVSSYGGGKANGTFLQQKYDQETIYRDGHQVERFTSRDNSGRQQYHHRNAVNKREDLKEAIIFIKPLPVEHHQWHKQMKVYKASPCMGCFHSSGRMWMMKGNGDKSKWKTKGMKKMKQREHQEKLQQ